MARACSPTRTGTATPATGSGARSTAKARTSTRAPACAFASLYQIEGEWDQGTCVRGRWVLPNGVFFEGSFENNKPKGQGKWRFPDSNICEGFYEQKEKEEGDPDDEDDEDKKKDDDNKPDDDDDDDKVDDAPDDDDPQDEPQEEKKKFKLIWKSGSSLLSSASQIKEIQALE
jgi:hypothetical protein